MHGIIKTINIYLEKAMVSLPLCIDPVKGYCKYVGKYCGFWPCCVNFTRSHIFNVIFIFYIVIFSIPV